LFRFCDCKGM